MAKRRTSGVQRRRATTEAMGRRLDAPRRSGLDMRILAIVGFLAVGLLVVVVAVVLASVPNAYQGQPQPNDGQEHVADGTDVRLADPSAYSSTPATSGPHWGTNPAQWGVYTTPVPESQVVHNLEHGGIVIWYQQGALDEASIVQLADYVNSQVATGIGGRFKFILSPWAGAAFEEDHPIAVTAWRSLLFLDEASVDAIRSFADARYQRAPENAGGPAPPA